MRYHEIIKEDNSIMDPVRDAVIDIMTPLAANGVQFVTVQQIMDQLADADTGVAVDRSLLMSILNPDQVKIINLNTGNDGSQRAVTQTQKQSEQDKIKDTAADQAKKNISN
jgi:hypothetical protein